MPTRASTPSQCGTEKQTACNKLRFTQVKVRLSHVEEHILSTGRMNSPETGRRAVLRITLPVIAFAPEITVKDYGRGR